jgi:hypothetical protein
VALRSRAISIQPVASSVASVVLTVAALTESHSAIRLGRTISPSWWM